MTRKARSVSAGSNPLPYGRGLLRSGLVTVGACNGWDSLSTGHLTVEMTGYGIINKFKTKEYYYVI